MRPYSTFVALLLLLPLGCNTGTRHDPGAAGSTAPGATAQGPLAAAPVALPQSQATQRPGPDPIIALAFGLTAGANPVDVIQIDVAASGTIDESTLGQAQLFDDTNANGLLDVGEPSLADATALTIDDGTYVFQPPVPIAIAAGQTRQFLVGVDTSQLTQAAAARAAGQTIELSVLSAAAIQAQNGSAPVAPSGTFPMTGSATLEFHDHLLISEIVTGPGSGATSQEYVELFNPTAQPVDLSDHYLSDYTDNPTNGNFHWKLPTGDDFGPAGGVFAFDFIVKFPQGTVIQPGQVLTVAVDGQGFSDAHGQSADYCMRNRGSSTAAQMLTWDGVAPGVGFSAAAEISGSAGLTGPFGAPTGAGESVFFFRWDGTSDLIVDVDVVNYGAASATNAAVNKSPNQQAGNPNAPDVQVDSAFDADATLSTFQDDSDDFFQFDNRAPLGASIERVDFTEGTEVKTGGNGENGHNETSEEFGDGIGGPGTFQVGAAATPGQIP